MSEWTNQIEQHPIHDQLRSVAASLETALAQQEERDSATTERLARLSNVVEHVASRLQATDSDLIPLQALNSLQQPLQRIGANLETYQTGRQPESVVAASNDLESLLVHSNELPVPTSVADIEGIREATTSLRRSIGQNLRHLESRSDEVGASLSKVEASLSDVEARLKESRRSATESLGELVTRFETAEDARTAAFDATQQRLTAAGEKIRTQELAKWSSTLSGRDQEAQALLNEAREAFKDLTTSSRAEAEAAVDGVLEMKAQAERLVGAITDTGMVSGYQKEANSFRLTARIFQVLAVLSFAALVVFALLSFLSFGETTDASWAGIGWRVFVATTFGLLAAYSARQADRADKASRKNRRMELELASITPYLHTLPDDKQIEMKMDVARRLFGQADSGDDKADAPTTGTNADIVRMAIEVLQSQLPRK